MKTENDILVSYENEQAVLASYLIDEKPAVPIEEIESAYFSTATNRLIFESIRECRKKFGVSDMLTVIQHLTDTDKQDSVPVEYIVGLTGVVPNSKSIRVYVDLLKDKYILRQIVKRARNLIADVNDLNIMDDVSTFAADVPARFKDLATNTVEKRNAFDMAESILKRHEQYKNKSNDLFVATGVEPIDKYFAGGLRPGLYVLAGRTGSGKTEFGLDLALGMAENPINKGKYIDYHQLELDDVMTENRIIAKLIGGYSAQIIKGAFRDNKIIERGTNYLATLPLFVVYERYTVEQLVASLAHERSLKTPLEWTRAIFIDQLSHIKDTPGYDGQEQYAHKITTLKYASKTFMLPIVLMSQLNRSYENIKNKADNDQAMASIRASGEIENGADVVMLVSRADKTDKNSDRLVLKITKDRIMEDYLECSFKREKGRLVKV